MNAPESTFQREPLREPARHSSARGGCSAEGLGHGDDPPDLDLPGVAAAAEQAAWAAAGLDPALVPHRRSDAGPLFSLPAGPWDRRDRESAGAWPTATPGGRRSPAATGRPGGGLSAGVRGGCACSQGPMVERAPEPPRTHGVPQVVDARSPADRLDPAVGVVPADRTRSVSVAMEMSLAAASADPVREGSFRIHRLDGTD